MIALLVALAMTMQINLDPYLNSNHAAIFRSTARELCVRGGANAGKSYSIADKLLLQSIMQGDRDLKALVIKRTLPSLRDTVMDILQKRAELFRLPLKINRNDHTGQCNRMRFLFRSMNNQEDFTKIKSITDVDFIWINEITELREPDYRMIKTRLRGGSGDFAQIVFDFNPVGKTSWVYDRFFLRNVGTPEKLHYTILDNPWASREEIAELRSSEEDDPNFYKIFFLGEWGELEGVIYNWNEVPLPTDDLDWYDDIFYGCDFGYSVDPAAVPRIYRKADEFWLEEVIYEKGLTNQALAEVMFERGVRADDPVYCDSAEPKSVDELSIAGISAYPAPKGQDSVRAGVDFLQSLNIHVVEGSTNILKEARSYVRRKDKDGNALPDPIRINNHMMDAIRYAIYTHMRGMDNDADIMWIDRDEM